jgi:magnesium-transporting ATPase (P-type)
MTTVDELDGSLVVDTKGAPEEVLARCAAIRRGRQEQPMTQHDRDEATRVMMGYARRGLRVLAFAYRALPAGAAVPAARQDAERDLCLAGPRCSTRPGPRSPQRSSARTTPASACTSSPATTA